MIIDSPKGNLLILSFICGFGFALVAINIVILNVQHFKWEEPQPKERLKTLDH